MPTTITKPNVERVEATYADATHVEQQLRVTFAARRVSDGAHVEVFVDYVVVDPSVPLDQVDWDSIWAGALALFNTTTGGGPFNEDNPVVI